MASLDFQSTLTPLSGDEIQEYKRLVRRRFVLSVLGLTIGSGLGVVSLFFLYSNPRFQFGDLVLPLLMLIAASVMIVYGQTVRKTVVADKKISKAFSVTGRITKTTTGFIIRRYFFEIDDVKARISRAAYQKFADDDSVLMRVTPNASIAVSITAANE